MQVECLVIIHTIKHTYIYNRVCIYIVQSYIYIYMYINVNIYTYTNSLNHTHICVFIKSTIHHMFLVSVSWRMHCIEKEQKWKSVECFCLSYIERKGAINWAGQSVISKADANNHRTFSKLLPWQFCLRQSGKLFASFSHQDCCPVV